MCTPCYGTGVIYEGFGLWWVVGYIVGAVILPFFASVRSCAHMAGWIRTDEWIHA